MRACTAPPCSSRCSPECCGASQVIYMTGWAPAASQPAALRRGSATVKLEDLAEMQRQRDLAASTAQGGGSDAGG